MTKEKEYTRTITDPEMEPYFLSVDDNNVTVNVKVTPDARYTNSTTEYVKTIGHYSRVSTALKTVINEKVNSQSYESLRDYMDEYNTVTEKLNKILNF